MSRVLLKYQGVQSMRNAPGMAIIILTDEDETQQISVFCDSFSKFQFDIRDSKKNHLAENSDVLSSAPSSLTRLMLPEVMCSMVNYMTNIQLCVVIVNVFDGVYQTVLEDMCTGTTFPIRVSDAILLAVANGHIPIYVDENVWKFQSVPYCKNSEGVSVPINTLSIEMLQASMKAAIEDEQYEKAQQIKEEIERRKR